jgi:hypothetical protein
MEAIGKPWKTCIPGVIFQSPLAENWLKALKAKLSKTPGESFIIGLLLARSVDLAVVPTSVWNQNHPDSNAAELPLSKC